MNKFKTQFAERYKKRPGDEVFGFFIIRQFKCM